MIPKTVPRQPEPDEVRQLRKSVTDAANALAAVWNDRERRPVAQAKLDRTRAALTNALTRHKLPT